MSAATSPITTYLDEYKSPLFNVDSVQLWFDIYEDETHVRCELSVSYAGSSGDIPPLSLDGEQMSLQSVAINGVSLNEDEYTLTEKQLTILKPQHKFTLTTHVIINPKENTLLMGLYQSRHNLCTQCEAEGFRRITYFLDRPDVMSHYKVSIVADKASYPMLLSNGNLISEQDLPDGRHQAIWEDPSLKPCYLFALVAGSFDVISDSFITCSGREILLKFYLEQGFSEQARYAIGALKRAMKWDEEVYGREYDLDIYMVVAVSDFTMGAMENKGLNIFNTSCVLANPETATDRDFFRIEAVIGHEYFHNWSGNRITCRDWFQLTLKEGLTVFRDHHFSMDMSDAAYARIAQVDIMRDHQFKEDSGPMAHSIRERSYIQINNFYTSTVYEKGSEVIGMLKTLLGSKLFHEGVDLYFSRHDGQAVTTEDFIQAMVDVSGRDLTQFQRWYDQAGTPVVAIDQSYDSANKQWIVTVAQSCPKTPNQDKKLPFHLPLAIGAITEKGDPILLSLVDGDASSQETIVLEITSRQQKFVFKNVKSQPIPSLLRGFSAPVNISYDYSDEELAMLMRYDGDIIARCDAGRNLMTRALTKCAMQYESQETLVMSLALIQAIEFVLSNVSVESYKDLMVAARLLSMPAISYLMQTNSSINIMSWGAAAKFIKNTIANMNEDVFKQHYELCCSDASYKLEMHDVATREYKNLCLDYLVATKKTEYCALSFRQFGVSHNMTDAWGALVAINQAEGQERDEALASFYDKWQHEPLVVNKWLKLHASANIDSCLESLQGLLDHPAFSMSNPNNVYALFGGFSANMIQFHRGEDGDGYAFLIDNVIKLDKINSLVAARMVRPLTMWRTLDAKRSQLMKDGLARLLEVDGLSTDLYEIVSKSLEQV